MGLISNGTTLLDGGGALDSGVATGVYGFTIYTNC